MAGVGHGVVAGVAARARLGALGRPRAARHRRVDDGGAARAGQLVEADAGAGPAVALVAQLLAPTQKRASTLSTEPIPEIR